jgi:hypothetical protein
LKKKKKSDLVTTLERLCALNGKIFSEHAGGMGDKQVRAVLKAMRRASAKEMRMLYSEEDAVRFQGARSVFKATAASSKSSREYAKRCTEAFGYLFQDYSTQKPTLGKCTFQEYIVGLGGPCKVAGLDGL